jgi:hypothetical protein
MIKPCPICKRHFLARPLLPRRWNLKDRGFEDRRAELLKLLQTQIETLEGTSFPLTYEELSDFKSREAHISELERELAELRAGASVD